MIIYYLSYIKVLNKLFFSTLNFDLVSFFNDWQTLIGAFVGSVATVFAALYIENKKHEKQKGDEYVQFLQNTQGQLVSHVNSLIEGREVLLAFIKNVDTFIENAESFSGGVFVPRIYIPYFFTSAPSESIFLISTKSNYLDNLLLRIYNRGNEFSFSIDDLRNQLVATYELNEKLVFSKISEDTISIKDKFIENIKQFILLLKDGVVENNMKIQIESCLKAQSAIVEIKKEGIESWNKNFDLENIKDLKIQNDLIDKYLENKIEEQRKLIFKD